MERCQDSPVSRARSPRPSPGTLLVQQHPGMANGISSGRRAAGPVWRVGALGAGQGSELGWRQELHCRCAALLVRTC